MATPNTAGAAIMVREYLEEIALRPSPQGALVKALLIYCSGGDFATLSCWFKYPEVHECGGGDILSETGFNVRIAL